MTVQSKSGLTARLEVRLHPHLHDALVQRARTNGQTPSAEARAILTEALWLDDGGLDTETIPREEEKERE